MAASDDLARLRAMVEAMTSGEWVANGIHVDETGLDGRAIAQAWSYVREAHANAAGIAALRNVAPELLAVAEAAKRAVWHAPGLDGAHGDQVHDRLGIALDALDAKLREVPR